jgi:hypothetical protein
MKFKDCINCACVIHGDLYPWMYVENLYHMLTKNFSLPVRLHVFTESHRAVPDHMIKHNLVDWPGVSGKKKGWWYKMQMFNPEHFAGPMLYFDLDVVISGTLDWVPSLDSKHFWSIRDFRYLWRPKWQGINSSMMWWDTTRFAHIWNDFKERDLNTIMRAYSGDQDYLTAMIDYKALRFVDENLIKSWRWQVKDGGMDMRSRLYRRPDAGSIVDPRTSVIVFHGTPKPHEINDPIINGYWKANTV